jgi:AcrR family transcriptional regulator
MGRVGPTKFTLAVVAKEVGLSPATLVQRFGSKRGLLEAFAKTGRPEDVGFLDRLRAEHPAPLAALKAYLLCFADMAASPKVMANHLAFFQIDLADPVFRRFTAKIFRDQEAAVTGLLQEALEAKELVGLTPKELAPVLLTIAQGSLYSWAIYRRGTARDWIARYVNVALRPYLPSR